MVLDKASAQPLYQQLEEYLRSQIDTGKLHPGDRIPGELELAESYGISRMTARRAIDAMVLDGTLFRQPGKGTFVAKRKVPYAPASLLSFSTAIRALGLAIRTETLDARRIPAPPAVARDLQLAEGEDVIFVKRLRFVEEEPVAIHNSYLPATYFAPILHEDLTQRPLNEMMYKVSGLLIVSSRDYAEAVLARPEEATLLRIRKGAPLFLLRGIGSSADGLPLRSTKAIYRGDRFRFSVGGGEGPAFAVRSAARTSDSEDRWLGLNSGPKG